MHHAPSGPSFTERLAAALFRALRPAHERRILVRPRLAGVLLGSVVIGLLVAAVPMVSTAPDVPASAALNGSSSAGTGSPQDPQSTQAHRGDVVEMGVDGAPASAATSSTATPTDAAPAAAPLPATLPAATPPGSASSSVAAPAGSGSATATTPAASPVLSQPPVTLPPVTVPPVTTTPSPSPTTTDASPSPSLTTDPTTTP